MPNYERAKIFMIVSDDDKYTYVGSTTAPTLAQRLTEIKQDFKRGKSTNLKPLFESSVPYQIILLEFCPCSSKDELTARQRYWTDQVDCINKLKPLTQEEKETYYTNETYKEKKKLYRQKNQSARKDYDANYYQLNREKILLRKRGGSGGT